MLWRALLIGGTVLTVAAAFVLLQLRTEAPVTGYGAAEPGYHSVDCPFSGFDTLRLSCAELVVPGNWDVPGGGTYALPVLIIDPVAGVSDLEPIVFLGGGPGASSFTDTLQGAQSWRSSLDVWSRSRRLIVLELRATPHSRPSLACPELQKIETAFSIKADSSPDTSGYDEQKKLARQCLAGLRRAGIDLAGVNRFQVARDVKALVEAMGLKKVVLFGTSYGTTFTMTVMDEHPEIVHSAILESVFPPEATAAYEDFLSYERVLSRLLTACEGAERCNVDKRDLRKLHDQTISRLKDKPVVVKVRTDDRGGTGYVTIDHIYYLAILRYAMSTSSMLGQIPQLISTAADRQYTGLALVLEKWIGEMRQGPLSLGGMLASLCSDFPEDGTAAAFKTRISSRSKLSGYEVTATAMESCDLADVPRAPARQRERLVSDIPTLLLQGEYDTATPAYLARRALKGLTNGQLFVFPFESHVPTFTSTCANSLIALFLAAPEAAISHGCLEREKKPFRG